MADEKLILAPRRHEEDMDHRTRAPAAAQFLAAWLAVWLGFLHGKRYLLIDRDPLYTESFRILKSAGVTALRMPAKSPNLNAFAERFVLSIKSEGLDRIVPLGEAHLRRAISEYVVLYHRERNHQGLPMSWAMRSRSVSTVVESCATSGSAAC